MAQSKYSQRSKNSRYIAPSYPKKELLSDHQIDNERSYWSRSSKSNWDIENSINLSHELNWYDEKFLGYMSSEYNCNKIQFPGDKC